MLQTQSYSTLFSQNTFPVLPNRTHALQNLNFFRNHTLQVFTQKALCENAKANVRNRPCLHYFISNPHPPSVYKCLLGIYFKTCNSDHITVGDF